MIYYLYILRCSDNSLYTGTTNNLLLRVKRHNKGNGPKFTQIRLPVKLVYFEKFDNLKSARKREKQIKGWRREKKEKLIKFGHPTKFNH
ncbi:MAG: GIY-YIG nuclease family protein [Patescibacteria group bacterium]|jgi:putative endonuclease